VQAAARATGVHESRLRTWERRYGVPRPKRSAVGRRLYDEGDIALIRRMAALVDAGIAPAQAAAAALDERVPLPPTQAPAAPDAHPLVAALVSAALELNTVRADELVVQAFAELGSASALDEVLFPALRDTGLAWETRDLTVAHEHAFSEVVRSRLIVATLAVKRPPEGAPIVVLACPEDERHELGLLGLRLLLGERGLAVCYLGVDVPSPDLVAAVRQLQPAAVCLSVATATALPMLAVTAHDFVAVRWGGRLFVGGAAIEGADAARIAAVRLPSSIGAAADLVASLLLGDAG
jgi:DNA-binding transcriptional MerR regulator